MLNGYSMKNLDIGKQGKQCRKFKIPNIIIVGVDFLYPKRDPRDQNKKAPCFEGKKFLSK